MSHNRVRYFTPAEQQRLAEDLQCALKPARPNLFGRRQPAGPAVEESALYALMTQRGAPANISGRAVRAARKSGAQSQREFYRAVSDAGVDIEEAEAIAVEASRRRIRPNHHLYTVPERRAFAERVQRRVDEASLDLLQAVQQARGLSEAHAVAALYEGAERAAQRFEDIFYEMGAHNPLRHLPQRPQGTRARLNYVERVVGLRDQLQRGDLPSSRS